MLDLLRYDETSPSGLVWSDASKHHKRPAGASVGCPGPKGYYVATIAGKTRTCHRLVWELHYGSIPEGYQIDHVDRNRANNKIENLRLVTSYGNERNKIRKYLMYTRPHKRKWMSRSSFGYHGLFDTELEAHIEALARRLELYWVI